MSINVCKIEKTEITEIVASGVLTQAERKDILFQIKISSLGCKKFLVNLLKTEFLPDEPMMGALDLVSYMKQIGITSNVSIFFATIGATEHRKFFREVASSSGFNIQYFSSREEALLELQKE